MAFRALRERLLLQQALDRAALRIGLRVFPEPWPGASLLKGFERLLARVPGIAGARGAAVSETQVGQTLLEAGFRGVGAEPRTSLVHPQDLPCHRAPRDDFIDAFEAVK